MGPCLRVCGASCAVHADGRPYIHLPLCPPVSVPLPCLCQLDEVPTVPIDACAEGASEGFDLLTEPEEVRAEHVYVQFLSTERTTVCGALLTQRDAYRTLVKTIFEAASRSVACKGPAKHESECLQGVMDAVVRCVEADVDVGKKVAAAAVAHDQPRGRAPLQVAVERTGGVDMWYTEVESSGGDVTVSLVGSNRRCDGDACSDSEDDLATTSALRKERGWERGSGSEEGSSTDDDSESEDEISDLDSDLSSDSGSSSDPEPYSSSASGHELDSDSDSDSDPDSDPDPDSDSDPESNADSTNDSVSDGDEDDDGYSGSEEGGEARRTAKRQRWE